MKTSLMIGSTYSKDNEGYPVFYRITDRRKRILISSGIYTRIRFTGDKFPLSEADSQIKTTQVRTVQVVMNSLFFLLYLLINQKIYT